MIASFFIAGAVLLLIAALFYWFNANSPLQTPIPLFAGGLGLLLMFLAFGGLVL